MKPKVAVIGTGGTISALGAGPFDTTDYIATGTMLQADEIVARFPELHDLADIVTIRFGAVASPNIGFPEWKRLVLLMDTLAADHPDLAGIVVMHGTATMEETAYALSLTAKVAVPIVVTGAQRPPSALSSDAAMNLAAAIRVAACAQARGMGVLVVMNDEIHAARDVTKTSTMRLQTFRTPDFGALGHVDGDAVAFYRAPLRRAYPDTPFDLRALDALPRVDIAYAYAGSDGTAVRAFADAGARGIVMAGFAPGFLTEADRAALAHAVRDHGIVAAIATRAGSGRVIRGKRHTEDGFFVADNLTPQKARILLALAIAAGRGPEAIADAFKTY